MVWKAVDPEKHLGRVVANGQCVRLCQEIAPGLPHTSHWRRGAKVRGGNVARNTIIATFGGMPVRYQNSTSGASHAAVFIEQLPEGLWVIDQWVGHPVAHRTIRFKGGAELPRQVNDGDRFYIVEGPEPPLAA